MLRFWTRFPLFLSLVIPMLLGCVGCRAQSANAETVNGPILPANTPVILRLKKSLANRDAKRGDPVEFEVGYDVVVNGQVVIQSGTAQKGSVRQLDHTGKGTAKVLFDLEPIQTVSEEVVRLTWAQIEKSDEPGMTDVVGWGAEAGPLLPAAVIASLFEKKVPKVLLPEGAFSVTRVSENIALDPAKQKAAWERYTARKKAAQVELCELLASLDSRDPERINSLARRAGLDDSSKADLLRRAGDLDGAIEVYQQLLTARQDLPCSIVPWLPVPFLGASEHMPAELREQLSKSFHAGLHFGLAELLREKGDFVHAVPEYRTAVQLDPDHEGSRIGLINALQDSGDLDAAIAESNEAIRIWPDRPYFHYLLGRVLVRKNDADAAIVELQWALGKTKNHLSPANCELGHAYELKGDLKAALSQYRTAYRAHVDDLQCRAAYERLELQLNR